MVHPAPPGSHCKPRPCTQGHGKMDATFGKRWSGVHGSWFMVMFLLILSLPALASEEAELPGVTLDLSQEAIKRGEEVYKTSCKLCHSLKYLGHSAITPPEAMKAGLGKEPPDLSLMAKARGRGERGAMYIYQLLMTYYTDKDGRVKNRAFGKYAHTDGTIAMPQPLVYTLDPQTEEERQVLKEADKKARDVAAFLMYAAEPTVEERKNLGRYVIGYMIVLTALLYLLNRQTWKGVKERQL